MVSFLCSEGIIAQEGLGSLYSPIKIFLFLTGFDLVPEEKFRFF